MNYELVRDTLKDGQIVFIEALTWKQKIISVITNGRFSHVGMLVWMTDTAGRKKLMCIESSSGGVRLVQLRAYLPRGMTVVDIGLNWEECAAEAFDDTGTLHYSIPNLVLIGLKQLLVQFNLPKLAKLVPRDKSGEVCSEFVATLLAKHGYAIDTFVSPNVLFDALRRLPSFNRAVGIDRQVYADPHK